MHLADYISLLKKEEKPHSLLHLFYLLNNVLQKITNQDYNSISTRIQEGLKQKIEETNSKGVIFGLSGGIDSAVIAYLCNNIVKEKTLAVIMPDSKISNQAKGQNGAHFTRVVCQVLPAYLSQHIPYF